MTIKKSRKRVVSILLILTLLLSLMPAAAFAADTAEYPEMIWLVNANDENVMLKDGQYLTTNDASEAQASPTDGSAPASYVIWYKNGVLTLKGYNARNIDIHSAQKVTIKLIGKNYITVIPKEHADGEGIESKCNTLITADAVSGGSLLIKVDSPKHTYPSGITVIDRSLTIGGYADITIIATANHPENNTDVSYGIEGRRSPVSIIDHASLDITASSPYNTTSYESCFGIYSNYTSPTNDGDFITINTDGSIKIDVSDCKAPSQSHGINSTSKVALNKFGWMSIKWGGDNDSSPFYPYATKIPAGYTTIRDAAQKTACYLSQYVLASAAVTVDTPLEAGTSPVQYTTKVIEADKDKYTIKKTWHDGNISAPQFTGDFEKGKTYILKITATAKDGYSFFDGLQGYPKCKINDQKATIIDCQDDEVTFYAGFTATGPEAIDSVSLTVDEPVGGAKVQDTVAAIADANPNYTITGSGWLDKNHNPVTGTFAAGQQYTWMANLTANDGYFFTKTTTGTVNDQNATIIPMSSETSKTLMVTQTFTAAADPKVLTGIKITTPPDKVVYTEGESFDPKGMVVRATYDNNSSNVVHAYTCSPSGALSTSDTEITVSYTKDGVTQTATQAITVKAAVVPKELTSIEITTPPDKVAYTEGESFDTTGMVVTAKYDDNSNNVVTSYTYSPDGALSTSNNEISVSYTEGSVTQTATQAITVKAAAVSKTLTGIEITTPPAKVKYTEGESFDPKGMVVTAKYDDNSSNVVTSYTYSPDGALSTSDTEITVSYTEGSVTQTATQAITVKAAPLDTVAAPSFAPSEKTFAYTVDVTLTTATEDADIYYTLDDSDPTVTSTKYTSAITLTDTTTIKAIAVKTGMTDSTISTATYTKQAPSAAIKDVTISGKLGTTFTAQDVTITLTNDTFKGLNVGQSVSDWFNLPQALITKIKSINTDKTSIVITIDGTPTEACAEQIAVSIPAMWLESGKDLTVTPNSKAKYNIAAADTYQLNITLGKNMTASGTLSQNITATHAMTAVTITADSGYYFPKDYANLGMLSGVTVARVDATTLTISGTPSMSRNINLADAAALQNVALPAAATGLVYNGGEQDSGIAENAGYTLTGELKGTAAKDYLATATLNDGYVWSDGSTDKAREIKWSIAKADITATAPTANTKLIYNGKAQDLITAGTTDFGDWQYKVNDGTYSTTIPQGTNAATYRVYFKIDGDDNHNAVSEKYFDVTIDKADPDYEVPTGLKGYQGRALSTVNLPGGWSWKDGSERMSKTGNQTFKATFTPNDTDNYNIIENIDVTVNVRSTALPGGAAQTEFGITAPKADNGSIGISQKEASAGTTIIVSLTPAEGYKAGSLTVTDKNGNKLTLKSAGENKYTFTMPNSAVDIKANFVKADGSSTVDPKTAIIMQIGNKSVNAYGKTIASDVAPLIINSRTMVPIRIVTETLGGSADWNALTKEVTLNLDGKTLKMTVGQTINKYGVAPMIIDGRTYVPIRFVADEMGAVTTWINATRTVVIEK